MSDVIIVVNIIDREVVEDEDGDIGVVVAVEDAGLTAAPPTVAGGVENVEAALDGDSSLD